MKNLKNIDFMKKWIYLLIIGFITVGCSDELNQEPFDSLSTATAFKDLGDFNNAVRGAYAGYRLGVYYGGSDGGSMIITPDIMSDNLIVSTLGRNSGRSFFDFNITADNAWTMWNNAYTTINRANRVIQFIDNLPAGPARDNIHGEALAIRALAHFDLLRVYAKKYEGSTGADLGVPYMTAADEPFAKPARDGLRASYDKVVADFVAAEAAIGTNNGVGRLNKASVNALLARTYLYMADWEKAKTASTAAIAAMPAANALAGIAQFPSIWTDATERDVLFKVRILDADNVSIGVGYQQTGPTGTRPEYSPTFELANLYKATDVRRNAYIGQTTFSGADIYFVNKYMGRGGAGRANVVDAKVIRTAEVYLTRAEARFRTNDFIGALADLNEVRRNRYSDFDAATAIEVGQALLDAILLERRLELAFEGHRLFDLKRLGLPIIRSDKGDLRDGTGTPATTREIPANGNKFTLAIPLAEIQANENIVQNPL
jgi:starch-binding outer membrane protein, SusD/RagB family